MATLRHLHLLQEHEIIVRRTNGFLEIWWQTNHQGSLNNKLNKNAIACEVADDTTNWHESWTAYIKFSAQRPLQLKEMKQHNMNLLPTWHKQKEFVCSSGGERRGFDFLTFSLATEEQTLNLQKISSWKEAILCAATNIGFFVKTWSKTQTYSFWFLIGKQKITHKFAIICLPLVPSTWRNCCFTFGEIPCRSRTWFLFGTNTCRRTRNTHRAL